MSRSRPICVRQSVVELADIGNVVEVGIVERRQKVLEGCNVVGHFQRSFASYQTSHHPV